MSICFTCRCQDPLVPVCVRLGGRLRPHLPHHLLCPGAHQHPGLHHHLLRRVTRGVRADRVPVEGVGVLCVDGVGGPRSSPGCFLDSTSPQRTFTSTTRSRLSYLFASLSRRSASWTCCAGWLPFSACSSTAWKWASPSPSASRCCSLCTRSHSRTLRCWAGCPTPPTSTGRCGALPVPVCSHLPSPPPCTCPPVLLLHQPASRTEPAPTHLVPTYLPALDAVVSTLFHTATVPPCV